ncbi:hypothetical protein HDU93_003487 [Gonapodya sp. JEL0774]|nr:hypothetical protein HDU93_003487 [Gonapodya sp. JEL0774]
MAPSATEPKTGKSKASKIPRLKSPNATIHARATRLTACKDLKELDTTQRECSTELSAPAPAPAYRTRARVQAERAALAVDEKISKPLPKRNTPAQPAAPTKPTAPSALSKTKRQQILRTVQETAQAGPSVAMKQPLKSVQFAPTPEPSNPSFEFSSDPSALDAILSAGDSRDLDSSYPAPPIHHTTPASSATSRATSQLTLHPPPPNSLLALLAVSRAKDPYQPPKRDSIYTPAVRLAAPPPPAPSFLANNGGPRKEPPRQSALLASGGPVRELNSNLSHSGASSRTPARPAISGGALRLGGSSRGVPTFESARANPYGEAYVQDARRGDLTQSSSAIKNPTMSGAGQNPYHNGGHSDGPEGQGMGKGDNRKAVRLGVGMTTTTATWNSSREQTTNVPLSRPTSYLDSPLFHTHPSSQSSFNLASNRSLSSNGHSSNALDTADSTGTFTFTSLGFPRGLPINDTLAHLAALHSSSSGSAFPFSSTQTNSTTSASTALRAAPPSPRADLTPLIASFAARRAAAQTSGTTTGALGVLGFAATLSSPSRVTSRTYTTHALPTSPINQQRTPLKFSYGPESSSSPAGPRKGLGPPLLVPSPSPANTLRRRAALEDFVSNQGRGSPKATPVPTQSLFMELAPFPSVGSGSSSDNCTVFAPRAKGAFALHRTEDGVEDFTMEHISTVVGIGSITSTVVKQDRKSADFVGEKERKKSGESVHSNVHQRNDVVQDVTDSQNDENREPKIPEDSKDSTLPGKGKGKKEVGKVLMVVNGAVSPGTTLGAERPSTSRTNARNVIITSDPVLMEAVVAKDLNFHSLRGMETHSAELQQPAPASAARGDKSDKENNPTVMQSKIVDITISGSPAYCRSDTKSRPEPVASGVVADKGDMMSKNERRKSQRERRTTVHYLPWGEDDD